MATRTPATVADLLRARLLRDDGPVVVGGVHGSSAAMVVALLIRGLSRERRGVAPPVCWLHAHASAAEEAASDLAYFLEHAPDFDPPAPHASAEAGRVRFMPALSSVPMPDDPVPPKAVADRLAALAPLAANADAPEVPHVVAPVSALMQRLRPVRDLSETRRILATGDMIDPQALLNDLVDAGFVRVPMVETPGEIAMRGGIVDIFPRGMASPWRLEFFGDEIESIRAFDAVDQVSYRDIDRLELFTAGDPWQRDGADPQDANGRAPEFATLLDYLAPGTVVVVSEPREFADAADLALKSFPQRPAFKSWSAAWVAVEHFGEVRVELSGVSESRPGAINVRVGDVAAIGGTLEEMAPRLAALAERSDELRILCSTEAETRRLTETLGDRGFSIAGHRNATATEGEIENGFILYGVNEVELGSTGILPVPPPAQSRFALGTDSPSAEFPRSTDGGHGKDARATYELPDPFLTGSPALFAVIQHAELFARTRRRRHVEIAQRTRAIEDILELGENDLVVHVTHGIARYKGLAHHSREGVTADFLQLEFADATKLYVPAVNVALVQKYVGAKGYVPELSKLGGKRWSAKKAAVEQAVLEMAGEYLRVQAERMAMPGIAYPPDDPLVADFEAAFPFQETPDQLRAAEDVRRDMCNPKPMDRLICGDVGFGKTEIAMRAMFRAVAAGYQVAVLVPTTVLAMQHDDSFRYRCADFPVRIESLSRFRTAAEQRQVIARARRGEVDVVIGTHRLLSKDVQFKNLGLVVIDEEQRFGVAHKEKLKFLRTTVDVLSLTATPIPRTLHMAMLGIRDISSLTTAPFERLAIHTEVIRADDELIRMAILRELARDGQCFFVHNRVHDIELHRRHLEELVPEARFAVGHGQMADGELEKVMGRFVNGKLDVLVCTTIVESGLDIPNANTIFIHNADHFGLAELHQLRGRVGRYTRQAYAYFMVDPFALPNPLAIKRLRAVAEYTHLGAGFHIAMRDLEIRGAGNLLGVEQSGHIAAVGYDLYCKLLQKSIHRLSREKLRSTGVSPVPTPTPLSERVGPESASQKFSRSAVGGHGQDARATPDEPVLAMPFEGLDLAMDLGLDLFIPDDYIPERRLRLEAYRKLFGAPTDAAREAVLAEMRDRYGRQPAEIDQLATAATIRVGAARLGITNIRAQENEGIYLTFTDWRRLEPALAPEHKRVALMDAQTVLIRLRKPEMAPHKLLYLLERVLVH